MLNKKILVIVPFIVSFSLFAMEYKEEQSDTFDYTRTKRTRSEDMEVEDHLNKAADYDYRLTEDGIAWWVIPGKRWENPQNNSTFSLALVTSTIFSGFRSAFTQSFIDLSPVDLDVEVRNLVNSLYYIAEKPAFSTLQEAKEFLDNEYKAIIDSAKITNSLSDLLVMPIWTLPILSKDEFKRFAQAVERVGAPYLVELLYTEKPADDVAVLCEDLNPLIAVYMKLAIRRMIARMPHNFLYTMVEIGLDFKDLDKKSCQLPIVGHMYSKKYDRYLQHIHNVYNKNVDSHEDSKRIIETPEMIFVYVLLEMAKSNVKGISALFFLMSGLPGTKSFDEHVQELNAFTERQNYTNVQKDELRDLLGQLRLYVDNISMLSVTSDIVTLVSFLNKLRTSNYYTEYFDQVGLQVPTDEALSDMMRTLSLSGKQG